MLAVLLLAGCAREAEPRWIPLAHRLSDRAATAAGAERTSTHPWHDGRSLTLVRTGGRATLRLALAPADWERIESPPCWRLVEELALPAPLFVGARRGTLRASTPEGPLRRGEATELLVEAGTPFFAFRKRTLALGRVAQPPEVLTLSCELGDSEGPGRVADRGFEGDGVTLLSGASTSCTLAIPPESVLRLTTHVARLFDEGPAEGECVFTVRLDGATLLEHRQRPAEVPVRTHHVLELPPEGRTNAHLELAAEGTLAHTAFLEPLIGPREIGRPGRRPWREARPDLVLFVADTFRADNLEAYGGRTGLTPCLDELARSSLFFRHATSTATWTLPAHASMFTGFYPAQVACAGQSRLSEEATTIAERLAAHGYRTVAVTEGGFVTCQFGLDQGFAHFQALGHDLAGVLREARAALAADDGRPLFLFVHTYRVHWPYRMDEATRAAWGERLGIHGDAHALNDEALALTRGERPAEVPVTPRLREVAEALHAHYLGGVAELDRDFAGFLAHLRAEGRLDSGYLVFTSDHGEAFAEHGEMYHHGRPHEEQARVPLLVTGRGLAPRTVEEPVSLVDLAPTLAEMAGLAPLPGWPGRSLLAHAGGRPVLSFEADGLEEDTVALREATRKLLLAWDGGPPEPQDLLGAFDLAEDEHERHDRSHEDWARELLARHAALLEACFVPEVASVPAELDDEHQAELEALGY